MSDSLKILTKAFYQRDDVLKISKELLGKILVTKIDNQVCKGRIVEVEAYNGRTDKACHAYGGRRTERTNVLYNSGGVAYVYLCYGIHNLFNVVTNVEGMADAILIRALEPLEGMEVMKKRINSKNEKMTNGPGLLSKAMGIDRKLNKASLSDNNVWIEEGSETSIDNIVLAKRIGIDFAEEDALLPWRFYIKGNQWVSKT
ncbi:MAG: DNA-3-methyladenine glycosylase [Reichenbachiella sp.]